MNMPVHAGVMLLLLPGPALASNPDGLVTLVVGIPALLAACVILAVLLAFTPRKLARTLALITALPTLILGLYVLPDAATLLHDPGTENFVIGAIYVALQALALLLIYLLVRRRPSPPP